MAVHLDDDVTEVALGSKHGNLFPARGLQGIVAHAERLMKELYLVTSKLLFFIHVVLTYLEWWC